MKHRGYVLALTLAMAGGVATAQMRPGGNQQPGGMGQPSGQHIPGMGEPGMGGSGRMPGDDQQQNRTDKASTPNVDDDTLLRQVHEQLARSNEFNDVKISVKQGVVTLEGSVPRKQDRKEAKQMAESVPGVRKVKEKLSIRPGGASASAGAPEAFRAIRRRPREPLLARRPEASLEPAPAALRAPIPALRRGPMQAERRPTLWEQPCPTMRPCRASFKPLSKTIQIFATTTLPPTSPTTRLS
jgi:hypothetical protein